MLFEHLDGSALEALYMIDDPDRFRRSGVPLPRLLNCLEEAAKECCLGSQDHDFSASDFEQVQRGFISAQRIVTATWIKESSNA